ncbi:MAG: EamA family transporter, partial [Acidiferrobacteraceae bacterium]|nr:EamA family transporter [Acidiferrobacteraceae bacterium]
MDHEESHLKGVALVLLGVVLLSPDALLLRLISADHWTLLFWRGTLSALSLVTI